MNQDILIPTTLIGDIWSLIDSAKSRIARSVNQEMTLLYWYIGRRIKDEIIHNERTDYGKSFGKRVLFWMVQCYESFPQYEIVSTLSAQLINTFCFGKKPINIKKGGGRR